MKTVLTEAENLSIKAVIDRLWPIDSQVEGRSHTRQNIINLAVKDLGLSFRVVKAVFLNPELRVLNFRRHAYFLKPGNYTLW